MQAAEKPGTAGKAKNSKVLLAAGEWGQTMAGEATVFVVGDDGAVRQDLCSLLRGAGHRSRSFDSAEALLGNLHDPPAPSCLISDLWLPGMSGLELQQAVASFAHLPLILISGLIKVEEAVRAMRAGAWDVFQKPLVPESLLAAVEQALAASRRAWETSQMAPPNVAALSAREQEVMDALLLGKKTTRIARELAISPSTVEKHRLRVLRKMRVDSVVDLLRLHMHRALATRTTRP